MRILNTHTEYIDPKNLFIRDEQIDQCCEPVSVNACADVGRVSVYEAAESKIDLDALKEKYQAKYPNIIINNVVLEDIGPDGPCGTMYETWEGRLNCCDEVEDLVFDTENSAEVIADNSSGIVVVTGGVYPRTVSVRGNGFYLDAAGTVRDGSVTSDAFTVYTKDACGTCEIVVTDGCSIATGYVMSTNGSWELVGYFRMSPIELTKYFEDLILTVTNSYSAPTNTLTFQHIGQYFLSQEWHDPMIGAETHTYSVGASRLVSCLNAGVIRYFKDPIVGVFDIPGINPYVHVLDANGMCGAQHDVYRIFSYYPVVTNLEMKIHRWVC